MYIMKLKYVFNAYCVLIPDLNLQAYNNIVKTISLMKHYKLSMAI